MYVRFFIFNFWFILYAKPSVFIFLFYLGTSGLFQIESFLFFILLPVCCRAAAVFHLTIISIFFFFAYALRRASVKKKIFQLNYTTKMSVIQFDKMVLKEEAKAATAMVAKQRKKNGDVLR